MLDDDTNAGFDGHCPASGFGAVSFCSTLMPGGDQARVIIESTTSFSFTCPGGGPPQTAKDQGDGTFLGNCGDVTLSADYGVTATFSG